MNQEQKNKLMIEVSTIRGFITNARIDIEKAENMCYELVRKINAK